jgi:transposase
MVRRSVHSEVAFRRRRVMAIRTVGIDIAKSVFHLVALDEKGSVVVKKKFSRPQLLVYTANLRSEVIGMEACSGAHFLARALLAQGHQVKLMPAEYVRPYVKSNKNDFIDAEAIAEAVLRPSMRFVSLKTEEQLDLQALHRVRERWIVRRVALTNQIRGLLMERGIPVRVGSENLRKGLPLILEDAENGLTDRSRTILSTLREEWSELEAKIGTVTEEIGRIARSDEGCKRLMGVPGIGPIVSTALVAAVGNATSFRKGRDLASWLGLVPRQHSSGGKTKLLGISKRGNHYIRKLMVEGARAAFARLNRSQHSFGTWMDQMERGKHSNVAVVALANKIARIAWAVLTTGQQYRLAS